MRQWKIVERVVGLLLTALGTLFSALQYYQGPRTPPSTGGDAMTPSWWALAMLVIGLALLGASFIRRSRTDGGRGGAGGQAKVGGGGVAIGGPGGHAGKIGRGGAGGHAEVSGDGIAVGGAGGSGDQDDLWRPPAQSAYETHMQTTGQPIDPKKRRPGRGGMSAGYAMRYGIVEKIRMEYFQAHHIAPQDAVENVQAVPLEYVNQKLAEMGVPWRARIVRELDYEFYQDRS